MAHKLRLGSAEKALGVSVDSVLNGSQRPSLATEEVSSFLRHCVEGIISCCSAPASLNPDTLSGFGPPVQYEY